MEINEFAKSNFMNYSMEVIKDRAIPAIDGCKPIHRRILYIMKDVGNVSSKPTRKVAKISGEVMGRVHPHGDSSINEALVRLSQSWKMRYPLVEIQGNNGNIQGDKAAAARYIECRLTPLGELMTNNIAKKCVPMEMNYSDEEEIPTLLTSEFPNVLCNPNLGIAVSMSSTTLPHNVNEICDALVAMIDKGEAFTLDDLMTYVQGPDFPTGGTIINGNELRNIYSSGRGTIKVRAKYRTETVNGKVNIVITEVPYLVSIEDKIYEKVKSMVLDEGYTDIENIQNNIGNKGFEIRIICRRGANINKVIKDLCEKTGFQSSISMNNTVLVDGVPRQLTFIELMREYLKFRHGVVRKINEFDRNKACIRMHIIDGLLIAVADIDKVIELIKESGSKDEARKALIAHYKFDEEQANAILDMRLSKLTRLEEVDLRSERGECQKTIDECNKIIINTDGARDKFLRAQLLEIKKKFGDARRTQIANIGGPSSPDGEKKVIPVLVARSGNDLYLCDPQDKINLSATKRNFDELLFTNTGCRAIVYSQTGHMVPVDLSELEFGAFSPLTVDGEIVGMTVMRDKGFLVSLTANGIVKKSSVEEYSFRRQTYAAKLRDDDKLMFLAYAQDEDDLLIFGDNDKAVRFKVKEISATGKNTIGSKGIAAKVRCATIIREGDKIVSVADGKVKLCEAAEYLETAKGGTGQVIVANTTFCTSVSGEKLYVLCEKNKISSLSTASLPSKSKTASGATIKGIISLSKEL